MAPCHAGLAEIRIRRLAAEDFDEVLALQALAYPVLSTVAVWRREHLESHLRNFPEGQFVAEVDGRVVGHSASFLVRSRRALARHTFREITARGTFDSHDPEGDLLYGAEIVVLPDYRRRGIAKKFYEARFDLARRLRLHWFAAGGRLPGYAEVAGKWTPEQYVRRVARGDISDRVLSPQLRSGLRVVDVLPNYLDDPSSLNFASLLIWENPDFQKPPRRSPPTRRTATKR